MKKAERLRKSLPLCFFECSPRMEDGKFLSLSLPARLAIGYSRYRYASSSLRGSRTAITVCEARYLRMPV